MKNLLCETRGQAFVELALVIFLFYLFITGIMQLVLLGSSQIRCQEAVRRAAWLRNTYNNGTLNDNREEVRAILNFDQDPEKISGDREHGMAYRATYTVPSLGIFHVIKPEGFKISAQSAVIAYNPKPYTAQLTDITVEKVMQIYHDVTGK